MNKFYTTLLTLVAVLLGASQSQAAETLYTIGNLKYAILNETSVKVYEPAVETIVGDLTIPQTVTIEGKQYTVTCIDGTAFKDYDSITNVVLPATIDSIDYQAFNGCSSLKSINLQDTKIRTLCVSTFLACHSLENITIPNTVTVVETNPFAETWALQEIVLAAGNQNYVTVDGVLYTKDMTRLVAAPGGKETVNIPSGVTVIGTLAFYNDKIKNVTFPNTLVDIENNAFYKCADLQKIDLPSSIRYIRGSAFRECKNATGEIILPEELKVLNTYAFYYTKISKLDIPASITTIPNGVAQNCVQLRSVTLHEGTTQIGSYAFRTCAISSIDVPNSVTRIQSSAFTGSTLLKTVNLGTGIKTIDTQVFLNLTSITNLNIAAVNPPSIADYTNYPAFTTQVYSNCRLEVPQESIDAYKAADTWKNFASIRALGAETIANDNIAVEKTDGGIAVLGCDGKMIEVYNLSGCIMYRGTDGIINLPAGAIYIVRVGEKTFKIAI